MSVTDLLRYFNLSEMHRQLSATMRRVTTLERRMGQLRDYVTAVQTETTRNAQSIQRIAKKLEDAIASGDPTTLADLGTAVDELRTLGDSLEAMAGGGSNDPLPAPPADNPS